MELGTQTSNGEKSRCPSERRSARIAKSAPAQPALRLPEMLLKAEESRPWPNCETNLVPFPDSRRPLQLRRSPRLRQDRGLRISWGRLRIRYQYEAFLTGRSTRVPLRSPPGPCPDQSYLGRGHHRIPPR